MTAVDVFFLVSIGLAASLMEETLETILLVSLLLMMFLSLESRRG